MGGSFIKIDGLEKTLARFDIKKFEPQIQTCFDKFGIRVELEAKQIVSRNSDDEGHLLGSIFHDETVRLSSVVGASVEYASFVEFGTRKYAAAYVATLPPTWQAYAAKTRGKGTGGSFDEFVQNIFAWVRRKGIGGQTTKSGKVSESKSSLDAMQSAAYAIALNILQNGIKPHPFLYPAVNKAMKQLIKDLQEMTFESTGFSKVSMTRRTF